MPLTDTALQSFWNKSTTEVTDRERYEVLDVKDV